MLSYAEAFNKGGLEGVTNKLKEDSGANKVAETIEDKMPDAKTTAVSGIVGGGIGAAIGSFLLPGIGTVLGAKLGAGAGLALGAWFSGPGKKMADKDAKKKLETTKPNAKPVADAKKKLDATKPTAGPANNLARTNINETVQKTLTTTVTSESASTNNNTPQYGNANNDNQIATELQTTNKLLKGIYQQSRN